MFGLVRSRARARVRLPVPVLVEHDHCLYTIGRDDPVSSSEEQRIVVARHHDANAKVLTNRLRGLRGLPGVTVLQEPPAPTAARADLKVKVVKARKWLLVDVAVICPATRSMVSRQCTHIVDPGASATAGEAVRRRKCLAILRWNTRVRTRVHSAGVVGSAKRSEIANKYCNSTGVLELL